MPEGCVAGLRGGQLALQDCHGLPLPLADEVPGFAGLGFRGGGVLGQGEDGRDHAADVGFVVEVEQRPERGQRSTR